MFLIDLVGLVDNWHFIWVIEVYGDEILVKCGNTGDVLQNFEEMSLSDPCSLITDVLLHVILNELFILLCLLSEDILVVLVLQPEYVLYNLCRYSIALFVR